MAKDTIGLDEFADEVANVLLEHVLWHRETTDNERGNADD